jgi:hypothetical protein
MRHKWRWLALLAITAVVLVTVAVAGVHSTSQAPAAGTAAIMAPGHNDISTAEGQMVAQHQQMTEQMRVDAAPGMLAMMNADPMWAQMRTGSFTRQLDKHQQQINRMLGLGG